MDWLLIALAGEFDGIDMNWLRTLQVVQEQPWFG